MVFDIILYDKYFNIPLRGLMCSGSSTLAFDASMLDEEPPEIAGRRGIYLQLRGFVCGDALRLTLEEKDAIFREWRAVFDKGGADTSSHPLYVDQRYQYLSAHTDELFAQLEAPVVETTGLMRVESGKFVFECLEQTSP